VNLLVDVGVRERDRDVFRRGSTRGIHGLGRINRGIHPL
jgi:hypothetical protein